MLIVHEGKRPRIDGTAFVAPTAVICGDVTLGPRSQVAFGAVLVAEGAPVVVGSDCMIRENAIVKGTTGHPVVIGDAVLIGPRAVLAGCTIEDDVFLATGVTVFQGARLGHGAEVRVNGVVHVNTVVAAGTMVPIGWIAVGNPAQVLPPHEHEAIWAIQKPLNFPLTVYGVDRAANGGVDMREIMRRVVQSYKAHQADTILDR